MHGEETRLNAAQLQGFVGKAGPALREMFDAKQVSTLQAVADNLQSSSLFVSGTKVAGGSDTVQNASDLTFGRALVGRGKQAALSGAGIATSAGAGYWMGGTIGAVLCGVLGTGSLVGRALAAARAAGVNTVDYLMREAMLNLELARVLLAKITPANKPQLTQNLLRVLGRASVLPPIGSYGKRQAPAGQLIGPPNSLLPYAGTGENRGGTN